MIKNTVTAHFRSLAVVPMLAALAGCAAFEVIAPAGDELPVDLVVVPADHGQWLETPEVAVTGAAGSIIVATRMSTPDPCRTVDATAYEQNGEIVVAIRVRPMDQVCVSMVGRFDYTATVAGLEPGIRVVRVTHLIEDTGNPGPHTVYRDEVEVG